MKAIWIEAAHLLGWQWSEAHGGYINESERTGPAWADYIVERDAEDACWRSGVETLRQVHDTIEEANCL